MYVSYALVAVLVLACLAVKSMLYHDILKVASRTRIQVHTVVSHLVIAN